MARNVQSKPTKTTATKISSRTTNETKVSSSRTTQDTIKESKTKLSPPNLEKSNEKDVKNSIKNISSAQRVPNGRVSTPPSRRVSKTQFFPTKNNYKELLNHLEKYPSPRRNTEQKKKISEKPKNVKQEEHSSQSTAVLERPRTSTLTKGNIVNQNIAGPDVPKEVVSQDTSEIVEDEVDYEDDFESYESDFESSSSHSTVHNISEIATEGETSTSSSDDNFDAALSPSTEKDEKKMDSGSFDLSDLMKKKQEQEAGRIRTTDHNFRSNLTSLSDEGFEESKSLQFLNFAGAREKHERKKNLEIRKKRGKELSNMIKLDSVNFTIFDVPAVTYDDFIRNFGNANSIQVGMQTGEENVDDFAQTEPVETDTKWVQMPPHVSTRNPTQYKHERLGVGPDLKTSSEESVVTPAFSEMKFEKFVVASGGLILDILNERKSLSDRIKSASPDNTISEGFLEFVPPMVVLGQRTISSVSFCASNPSYFLSVHVDPLEMDSLKSFVCLWNMKEVVPEFYLVCYGKISSCCFGSDSYTVFAGLENGIIIVWNLRENLFSNRIINTTKVKDLTLRNPTFLTDLETSHCYSVVSIQSVLESNKYDLFDSEGERAKQICSLDHEGTIIIWNIIEKYQLETNENMEHTPWEKLMLYKNLEISLRYLCPDMTDLCCNDMILTNSEPKCAFVATNYGSIIRCTLNKEKKTAKVHDSDDSLSAVCLSICPFSNMHFLAGFDNGDVNLYASGNSTALMTLSNKKSGFTKESIDDIQWSTDKPCTFYTKTEKNCINVWNLRNSNVSPVDSITFKEPITCIKLSSIPNAANLDDMYMIISTDNVIYMHLLNRNQHKNSLEDYHEEIKIFLNYVNRL
ncbi:hypothetical protein HHI36_016240 [Cryptolaemus montrouzieri]|uniref:WD repeat-containing protein 60 n=1 Tax=Cryptolaemus montrouzieri TaxID=559131 RepID=A0ABD2NJ44_9CUCU